MNTKYKNLNKQLITQQQAFQSSFYNQVYLEDNVVKRVDEYSDGKFNWIKYYKNDNETDNAILSVLRPLQPASGKISIIKRESYGGYTIENEKRYEIDPQVPFFEYRSVVDGEGRAICSEAVTIQQYIPNESHINKSFYDEEIYQTLCEPDIEIGGKEDPDFLVFQAFYNIDGSLDYIVFNPRSTYDHEYYNEDDYT